MCGIIGIAALTEALSDNIGRFLRKCLERLEYRGYDSAGIAVLFNNELIVKKGKGKIHEVNRKYSLDEVRGYVGIGHVRWSTHGKPSDYNAHPHTDCTETIAIVHNGIISNFQELKARLESRGHKFRSETDTEVIAHLIEEYLRQGKDFFTAFKKAINELEGTYAIAVITKHDSDKIYFAKQTSPLVIGIGDGVNFIASDIPAFLEFTRKVIVLRDGEYGYITPTSIYIEHNDEEVSYRDRVKVIDWSLEMASKEGYPHFMLKEIHEQPLALKNTILGLDLDVIDEVAKLIINADNVFITGAGTSYHAGLVCDYLFTTLCQVDTHTFIASEYRRYEGLAEDDDVLIAISQSGETIDTLLAARVFKNRGTRVISICNVIDSAIPRESEMTIYTRAGPEIGVAATKTFTTQLAVLTLLALRVANLKGLMSSDDYKTCVRTLTKIPEIVHKVITHHEAMTKIVGNALSKKQNAYYLSRGLGVPIAMEGALKLKEIAYIHAEAYPAGESKHGPIALVEEGFPTLFVILDENYVETMIGNVMEMKARDALTIGLVAKRYREKYEQLLDIILEMPSIDYRVATIPYVVPLQLIAYYASVSRGYDPDKPRNLAKTVTVE